MSFSFAFFVLIHFYSFQITISPWLSGELRGEVFAFINFVFCPKLFVVSRLESQVILLNICTYLNFRLECNLEKKKKNKIKKGANKQIIDW